MKVLNLDRIFSCIKHNYYDNNHTFNNLSSQAFRSFRDGHDRQLRLRARHRLAVQPRPPVRSTRKEGIRRRRQRPAIRPRK